MTACIAPLKYFSLRESSVYLLTFDEFSQNIIQENFTFLLLNWSHPTWQDQSKPYNDEFNGSIQRFTGKFSCLVRAS
jgi:hypothetical protein